MGLADFFSDLIPQRWKEKIEGPSPREGVPVPVLPRSPEIPLGGMPIGGPAPTPVTSLPVAPTGPSPTWGVPDEPVPGPYNPNQIKPQLSRTDTNVSPSALPPAITADPTATRPRNVDAVDRSAEIRPSRFRDPIAYSDTGRPKVRPFNYGADRQDVNTQYRDAVQAWEPQGAHRGIGNTLKGAWQGFQRGGIPGAIVGTVGSLVTPNMTGRIDRQGMLAQANAAVGQGQKEAERQAQIEALQVKPQLAAANLELATLKSQQNQQKIDDQRNRSQGYLEYLKSLPDKQKKTTTVQLLQAGALNTPEGLSYAAETLGVPVTLLPKFISGEIKSDVDATGQIVDRNVVTGEVKPTGVKSFAATKEAGQNQRAAAQISAANKRAALRQTTGQDPDVLYNKASQYWAEAQAKRAEAAKIPDYEKPDPRKAQLIHEAQSLENRTRTLQERGDKIRPRASGASTATPSGKKFSLSKWAAANPGKDTAAARAAAQQQGFIIVD